MQLVCASANPDKVVEIQRLLAGVVEAPGITAIPVERGADPVPRPAAQRLRGRNGWALSGTMGTPPGGVVDTETRAQDHYSRVGDTQVGTKRNV